MHGVGVIDVAANLIGKTSSKVEALVVGIDIETTSVLWHSMANVSHVVGIDNAIAIDVFELGHAWECILGNGFVLRVDNGIAILIFALA